MADTHAFRITLEVARSDPRFPTRFDVPVPGPASRVLDALLYVREHLDPSLGFRYSCRAGMCGACAVVVNGKEALSCQTAVGTLGTTTVHVAPLRALPVTRDLMYDLAPFFDALKRADAALRPREPVLETPRVMPPGDTHRALIERQNGCITCGACYSACATAPVRPGYLGPAAVNRALMLSLDERDAIGSKRRVGIASEARALTDDALARADAVCPVGIPLRDGIAKLTDMLANESR
jgi:succinate dehydrogenase/fumarate reductase iron-sulfur protein